LLERHALLTVHGVSDLLPVPGDHGVSRWWLSELVRARSGGNRAVRWILHVPGAETTTES
jgi:hypothetical protein